jgi:hypothetical protein
LGVVVWVCDSCRTDVSLGNTYIFYHLQEHRELGSLSLQAWIQNDLAYIPALTKQPGEG